MKPHLNNLVTHLVFPVLCLSEEDVEKFEDEPEEYLHRKLNFYEEASAPDVAATNFLVTLTKVRRKQTFELLQFINSVVSEYEQAPNENKNHIAKEGALRMIGTLAPVLLGKKSPIADQVEYFLVRYVFPDFTSSQGYLRARACDTIEKFEQLNFKDQNNLLVIYRNILDCMADRDLPVRVTAALALQPLIRHDTIRISMQQSIPTIMQQLLKLANECDIDALANVMEDFVEVFATELTPFAVALSEQLRDTYLRIVRELLDKNESRNDDGEEYGDYLDDKSITALGVLQTIGTLILTLESTPDVLLHIEAVLMPVIQITLQNKLYGKFKPSAATISYHGLPLTLLVQIYTTKCSRSSTAVLLPQREFLLLCGRHSSLFMPLSSPVLSCTWKICYLLLTTLFNTAHLNSPRSRSIYLPYIPWLQICSRTTRWVVSTASAPANLPRL
jgi:importin-7